MTDGPTGPRPGSMGDQTAQRPAVPPMSTSSSPRVPSPPAPGAAYPTNAPTQAPERPLSPPAEPQPSGPGLAERVQSRLSRAREEHRQNAQVQQVPPRRQSSRRPPRRARLRLTRIDPWSVMKTAFLLSIAFGVVTVVSVLMVWSVLGAAGVWESINATVQNVLGEESATTFDIENYLGTSRVLGFTLLISVVDVVLLTAIATLAAFLYNMAAALLGGVEVTLAEEGR
jgi:transmembrane protein DUF3566